MLSDCLRPEVAAHGIGVSTICPGIVDTNITRTSTFSGLDDAAQDARRARAASVYGRRNFRPEAVATEIVDAVRRSKAVVPVTPEAKVVRLLSRLAPGLLRTLAAGGLDRGR
jgi:short-subunit dehydrogenase